MSGNRCGHNPLALRTCDIVKRGRKGAPQVLQIASAYVGKAAKQKQRLKAWQNLNGSGRGRRSEIREAMAATVQYLLAKDFNLESRRCARRSNCGSHIIAPDAQLIATQVSKSWKGTGRISEARVRAVIGDFVKCGYITLSKQHRTKRDTGEWQASSKVITFTKAFFLDLGGKKLWRKILKESSERADKILEKFSREMGNPAEKMANYFSINFICTPRQSRQRPPSTAAQSC